MAKSTPPRFFGPGSTTLPELRFNKYGDLTYTYSQGSARFRVLFTGIDQWLSRYKRLGQFQDDADKIVQAEYRRLGGMVQGIFREWAPEGPGKFTVTFKNGSSKTFGHDEHLADTIRAQVVGNLLTVRMAWWGWVTTEGRAALPFKGHNSDGRPQAYPYIDQYGDVKWAQEIGPATRWPKEGESANERMKWLEHAQARIRYERVLESTALIIAQRIAMMIGLMQGGMEGVTARKLAIPKHAERARQRKGIRRAKAAGMSYGRRRKGRFKNLRKSRLYQARAQGIKEKELREKSIKESEAITEEMHRAVSRRVEVRRFYAHRNRSPRYNERRATRTRSVVRKHIARREHELRRLLDF